MKHIIRCGALRAPKLCPGPTVLVIVAAKISRKRATNARLGTRNFRKLTRTHRRTNQALAWSLTTSAAIQTAQRGSGKASRFSAPTCSSIDGRCDLVGELCFSHGRCYTTDPVVRFDYCSPMTTAGRPVPPASLAPFLPPSLCRPVPLSLAGALSSMLYALAFPWSDAILRTRWMRVCSTH